MTMMIMAICAIFTDIDILFRYNLHSLKLNSPSLVYVFMSFDKDRHLYDYYHMPK